MIVSLLALAIASAPPAADKAQAAPQGVEAPADAAGKPVGYSVEINGIEDQALRERARRILPFVETKAVFRSRAAIRRAAAKDAPRLVAFLQSEGYYAATAEARSEPRESGGVSVTYEVALGPKFTITGYRIVYTDGQSSARPQTPAEAGVKTDGAPTGAALQAIQAKILGALQSKGFPTARVVSRRADAHLADGVATAVFTFSSGPLGHYGEVRFDGLKRVSPKHARKYVPWTEGDVIDKTQLGKFQDKLSGTGLFKQVNVTPGAPDAQTGLAPILVTVAERKPRTIGLGANYSTDRGFGARTFWEHRNLFHRGEKLRIQVSGAQYEQGVTALFSKPLPNFPGSAFASASVLNETTDAFDALTIETGGGLSRKWLDGKLETRGGINVKTTRVNDGITSKRFNLVSAPLLVAWADEDSLINPTRGTRSTLSFTPFTGSENFAIAEWNGAGRTSFGENKRYTLAVRAALGATLGPSTANIPATERFYAGGAGSIRGFAYQAAGPLDANGNPAGGRSLIEAGFEARARVMKDLQLAAFFDAGQVAMTSYPDFTAPYFGGAGVGVRYLTPAGPIRLDVAFPVVNKRSMDSAFQIIIGLGQPF